MLESMRERREEAIEKRDASRAMLKEATPRIFVTHALIALNGLCFILLSILGVSTEFQRAEFGSGFGPLVFEGEWWRVLGSNFIHRDVLHLTFNMAYLWAIGRWAERLFGNWAFLTLYLVSGLGGSVATLWWLPELNSNGASSAVFGIIGGTGPSGF